MTPLIEFLLIFLKSTQPKIYKLFYKFLKSIFACHKSSWLINSHLRYGWFKNSVIWLDKKIFDPTQRKFPNYLPSISLSGCFKTPEIWLVDSYFDHTQLNIHTSSFTFLESISTYQKLCWFIWRIYTVAIWLAESILVYDSRIRI